MGVKFFLFNHSKKNLVSLRFYHSGKSFEIVNAFMLFKPLCNSASFVSLNITVNIAFVFESLLCCQDVLIYWALNNFPSSICNKRVILGLHSFILFASFTTPHCFLKAEFIRYKPFIFASKSNKFLKSLSWYVI